MQHRQQELLPPPRQVHPRPGTCRVFAGKGHNGGDVLVAARYLAESGWRIEIEPVFPIQDLAPLTAKQLSSIPTKTSAGSASSGACKPGSVAMPSRPTKFVALSVRSEVLAKPIVRVASASTLSPLGRSAASTQAAYSLLMFQPWTKRRVTSPVPQSE